MERPGDGHHHHHQQVASDTDQEDGGLENGPDETVESAVILWLGTQLLVILNGQERVVQRFSTAGASTTGARHIQHWKFYANSGQIREHEATAGSGGWNDGGKIRNNNSQPGISREEREREMLLQTRLAVKNFYW